MKRRLLCSRTGVRRGGIHNPALLMLGAVLCLGCSESASSDDGEDALEATGGNSSVPAGSEGTSDGTPTAAGDSTAPGTGASTTPGAPSTDTTTDDGSGGNASEPELPAGSGGTPGEGPQEGRAGAGQGGEPEDGAGGTSSGGENTGGASTGGTGQTAGGSSGEGGTAAQAWTPSFQSLALSSDFISEGAAVADVDGDGELDLIAGPTWYRGPEYEVGGNIDDAPVIEIEQYSLFFLTFADDVNGDGLPDVIAVGDAGGRNGSGTPNAHWYENPGPDNLDQAWTRRPVLDGLVSNESPVYADLVGDATSELVFMTDRQLGYAVPGSDPNEPWEFQSISGSEFNTPYVHGLGVGDVNGDGLNDVIEASGWWEQIADGSFEQHPVDFTEGVEASITGGAQMYTFDVDGDGDNDVVTSLSGHGYGLSWFEQTDGGWAAHGILSPDGSGDSFSQLHAVGAADLNGDGLLDVVTGKRYYAHAPPTDPGGTDPAVLYWFELSREGAEAEFVPHLIHDDSGVGCNFTIRDLNGDGRVDIFTSSKKGTFLHLQE